jgi:hypothetical protein
MVEWYLVTLSRNQQNWSAALARVGKAGLLFVTLWIMLYIFLKITQPPGEGSGD